MTEDRFGAILGLKSGVNPPKGAGGVLEKLIFAYRAQFRRMSAGKIWRFFLVNKGRILSLLVGIVVQIAAFIYYSFSNQPLPLVVSVLLLLLLFLFLNTAQDRMLERRSWTLIADRRQHLEAVTVLLQTVVPGGQLSAGRRSGRNSCGGWRSTWPKTAPSAS